MTTRNGHFAMPQLKTFCTLVVLFLLSFALSAQSSGNFNPWALQAEAMLANKSTDRQIIPSHYLTYRLDITALAPVLLDAPLRFSTEAETEAILLSLPLPDGSTESFRIYYAPVMAPGLAARYPNIRTYAGVGVDDPTASVRLDLTPKGFHAMIHSARHSTVFIDPYAPSDNEHYIVYYKKDFTKANADFECHTVEESASRVTKGEELSGSARSLLQGDCRLRTYRLALTCTGEYAQFHGGTIENVLAAMNTSMVRVNGVYERDLNVTMEIVENNDLLIFLDAGSDPYNDGNPGQMIGETHTQCVNIIGSANFDIGHIFSTQGGGLAGLGVVCSPNRKGNGVTGIGTPVGDPFDIDYVSHEMGHQFGAGHTQGNSCNRSGPSAMEPGSASTIMGYAGICAPNVQNNSDDYFHAISIQQMANYINNGEGDDCPVYTETGNSPPDLAEVPDYVLPVSTPFRLTAVATDADDDALTYCWEQMDNEVGPMPPQPTNTQGPVFRSFDPTESPIRYFPRLTDLVNNSSFDWESLPAVSRDMSFRVTVRDNAMGGGCTTETDMELEFTDTAGPFLVASPNTNVTWQVGQLETVTWDVAGTDAAPVSCANVDILLSLDGGFTYTVVMAANVPNTGSYELQVPNQVTDMARVMVVCSDNIFFDISNENFTIEAPTEPTFVIETTPVSQTVCGTVETVEYTFELEPFVGFDQVVTLSADGTPADATVTFSDNQLVPPFSATLTIGNLSMVESGTYAITLNANSDSVSIERPLELTVVNGTIDMLALIGPEYGADEQELSVGLSWEESPLAESYIIEIATSPVFGNTVIETATINNLESLYQTQNLDPRTVYYWRVAANSLCGQGLFSTIFAFQTKGESCVTYQDNDLPLLIPADSENTVTAALIIPDDITILSLTTSMDIAHTWVGDLEAVLQSPMGTQVSLFDQPGIDNSNFGCDDDNLLLTFDDQAVDDAEELANTCGDEDGYAINGTFQSIDPLSAFVGSSSAGEWSLIVTDNFDQDGGQIDSWSIDICFESVPVVMPDLVNDTLIMTAGTTVTIPNSHLLANLPGESATAVNFLILSLPMEGNLNLNGMPAQIGDTFTQADIDNDLVEYTNTNTDATQDVFRFNVTTASGAWIPNEGFVIVFGEPTLAAAAYVSATIGCSDDADGAITVNASGPEGPFMYSLDGMEFQASNVFAGLASGTYFMTVMDAAGNTVNTNLVTLAEGTQLSLTLTAIGNTVTANVTGAESALMYSIDGENFQSENIFADLPNGDYEITVLNEIGCSAVAAITINLIQSATITTLSVQCPNGNDGAIIITGVTGGTPPYQYSVDGGETYFAEADFLDLMAGTYFVTILDAMGNVFDGGEYIIAEPPTIVLATQAIENIIEASATGGTGDFMYSIDGGNTFQSSGIFAELPNGEYVIIVVDENGCTRSSDTIIIDIVGVNDLTFDLSFSLFPNPVNTQLTLELQQPTASDVQVRIYDVAGRLLQEHNLHKTADYLKTTIDVTQLPAGSYELVLTDGALYGRGRFVKL